MSEAEGAGVADEATWTTEEGVTEAGTTALVLWVDGDGDEVGVTSTASTDEVVLEGEGVAEAGTTAELEEVTSTGLTDESVHVSEADAAAELGLLVAGAGVDVVDDVTSTASTEEVVGVTDEDEGVPEAGTTAELEEVTSTASTEEVVPEGEGG